ncbi:MAG: DUF3810 domain-containing protein [Lachnospiraceae bacterium]|nr:DUF3810 domain-containing protein [Lachnospiraceae bacterium]
MRRIKKLILPIVIVILNLLACIRPFCDAYKRSVYPLISDVLGRINARIPFALGEILMYLGAAAVLLLAVLAVMLLFLRKREGFRKWAIAYCKGFLIAAQILLLIYTLNWVIPFRASILTVPGATERGYTLEEVGAVRDHIVTELNSCALEVSRDESGNVIYDRSAMDRAVFSAMRSLSEGYPSLSGYYPPMKDALCSDFLEWMNIGGYTYPYTMEVTWNRYCHDLYYPFLLAHESSHHQGYYQENEANYLAFLSLIGSEDPLLRYAGYNEIYYYIENAFYETAGLFMPPEEVRAYLLERPAVSDLVKADRAYARAVSRERYDADSHPAQSLSGSAAKAADVGWSVQGDVLQENSYDGVVKMVLQYYDVYGLE